MDRRALLLELRTSGKLKGMKPCFVTLGQNIGKVYTGGTSDFIMSYKNKLLHFQKLSFFFHVLKPKDDFSVDMTKFTEYHFEDKGRFMKSLFLYTKDGRFLQINYQANMPHTFSTEENIARIIEDLKGLGMKETNFDEE